MWSDVTGHAPYQQSWYWNCNSCNNDIYNRVERYYWSCTQGTVVVQTLNTAVTRTDITEFGVEPGNTSSSGSLRWLASNVKNYPGPVRLTITGKIYMYPFYSALFSAVSLYCREVTLPTMCPMDCCGKEPAHSCHKTQMTECEETLLAMCPMDCCGKELLHSCHKTLMTECRETLLAMCPMDCCGKELLHSCHKTLMTECRETLLGLLW